MSTATHEAGGGVAITEDAIEEAKAQLEQAEADIQEQQARLAFWRETLDESSPLTEFLKELETEADTTAISWRGEDYAVSHFKNDRDRVLAIQRVVNEIRDQIQEAENALYEAKQRKINIEQQNALFLEAGGVELSAEALAPTAEVVDMEPTGPDLSDDAGSDEPEPLLYHYNSPEGRVVIGVRPGLDRKAFGTFYGKNGSMRRVKSNHLPMRKTFAEAQEDLDNWAANKGLELADSWPETY